MNRILVIRLSSMGDVLLTRPVILGALARYPDLEITFVTDRRYCPYFEGIGRLVLLPYEPETRHRGLPGLFRLFRDLRQGRPRIVADLHGVLRTWILDCLFILSGSRVFRVNKHRRERRRFLKGRASHPLPHATQRYLKVFSLAGYPSEADYNPVLHKPLPESLRIGIAPLARHTTKTWGLEKTRELCRLILDRYNAEIHLFGGRSEHSRLAGLESHRIHNQAGILDADGEMDLITSCHLFISMDSANMHLATMCGVPTISIWGATDPDAGFGPTGQPGELSVSIPKESLYCRPCSIYGEKPCRNSAEPMACMNRIGAADIFGKVQEILSVKPMN